MATKNEECAAQVGQEKPTKDVVEVYDSKAGKYQDQKPAIKPSGTEPSRPQGSPFKLGGNPY